MNLKTWKPWLAITAASAVFTPFVVAQDGDDELEELQTLTFTGTRLTGAEVEGSLPLVTYTQEDIKLSPATSPVEFLRDLPIVGGPSTQSSNFTNGTDGAARVGLRTISGGNTLILLNGRRLTPSGTGATPDLNQIPLAAVKKIEILKAGGSVTYGTSAVAGVINFILDDEFEGLEFNVGYGQTEDAKAPETTTSFIVGGRGAGGKFKFTMGGSYRKEGDLMAPDRPWMLGGGHSILPNPGLFFFAPAIEDSIISATGLADADYTGIWTLKNGIDVATGPGDFIPFVNTGPYDTDSSGRNGHRFPYENFTISVNPNQQHSVYGTADYEINDKWDFFSEFGYSYSELEFRLAPSPVVVGDVADTNYWMRNIFGDDVVDVATTEAGWEGVPAYAYYRFLELGARINQIERRSLRTVLGVRGELPYNWNLEAYALYSDEKTEDRELNGGSEAAFYDLLESSGPDAYNLFAASWIRSTELGKGNINPAAPNAELANEIRADNETDGFTKTELVDFRLNNPEIFELPAGPVEIVLGAEWRHQWAKEKPDNLKLAGSLGWNAADGVTEGGREVYGMYTEAGIPVIENLDISLSARYEDYRDEFTTDVYGINARYQPIRDLTLRASFSQGFIAPDLIDLYNPGFGSFPELNDPFYAATNPLRLYQVETFYVGSQETGVSLKPEQADIYSVGFTYSPSQFENLDITVDWWRIEKVDLIAYSVQGLLNEFRRSYPGGNDGSETHPPASNPYLSENGGAIVYDPTNPEPVVQILGAGPRNVAAQNVEGIDFTIRYSMDTDSFGSFDFVSDSSYIVTDETQGSDGNFYNSIGQYDGDVAYPRFRSTLSTFWYYGDFTVNADMNYTHRSRDIQVNPADEGVKTHVNSHIEWDLVVSYELPFFKSDLQSTTVSVGVENLFDKDPPRMSTAFSNNYPERNYDPRGRYYFIRVNQAF